MKYRARPPRNRQNHDNSCWAAALDSFSRVTAGVPVLTERSLCSRYGDPGNEFALDGARLSRLETDLESHGVTVDLIPYLQMPYDLEDRLQKSHVVIAWCVGGTDWHANLVYGVDGRSVSVMETRDGSLRDRPWNYYVSAAGFYLFWKP